MAIQNSRYMRVYLSTTAIAEAQDANISMNTAMRDTTTKDSGGNATYEPGISSATISTSGLYKLGELETTGADLWDAFANKTSLTIYLKDEQATTGEIESIQYTGYLSSLEVNSGGAEDNVTYSASFQCTGAPTKNAAI